MESNVNENSLGTEKISKLFIKYSVPAIISMVIAGMQIIIDGLCVGNFVGENAMASVNMAQPFYQLTIAASMMISVGSLSYMGRSLGEKDVKKTQNIFRTSLILLVVLAMVLGISGFFFSEEIALILGTNEVLLKDTAIYIKMISIFLLPMFLVFQFGFANRLIEKPELYFKAMILGLFANIILNYLLIKVMGLGTMGAGIATGLANTIGFVFVISPQLDKKNIINIFSGKYDSSTIIPVVYNGSSEAMTSVAGAITAYLFNMAFMDIAGESGVAAFTIINYIALFSSYVMFGIGDGIGPIISYNYGARNYKRVKKVLNLSYIVAAIIGIILFIILFFFAENLIGIFGSDNQSVKELAVMGSKLFSFGILISGFNILNSGYFTAIGLAKESVIIALSRGLIFIVIGIFILPRFFAGNGIWLSVPFAEVITLGICYYLMKGRDSLMLMS